MTALAFDLNGVRKSYRVGDGQIEILHGIHLQIPVGQYVAIMGPSGSGKSTLMQLLGCLDVPTQGSVCVMGQDTSQLSDDDISSLRSRALGFVFQAFNLLPSYDAVSNVGLGMVYSGSASDRTRRAMDLLDRFGLSHRYHHRPRMMSGGEQQRVAIARSLANDPPIILADEPTGALDQANGKAILGLFDEMHAQGKTVLMVTHDPAVAARAQRVIEIVDGVIHADGSRR